MENEKKKQYFLMLVFFPALLMLVALTLIPAKCSYADILDGSLILAKDLISPDPPENTQILQQYGNIPLQFEANMGQYDRKVRFLCRGHGHSLFLTDNEAVLVLGMPQKGDDLMGCPEVEAFTSMMRMLLAGSNPHADIAGMEELPGRINYFKGNDSDKWRANFIVYRKVK
ncbi:MAG: hypothetical protein JW920_09245 [Deltaproteobacteria bacterium]|nr:hypothetical protein [Deltaproteobacteria bacterium]